MPPAAMLPLAFFNVGPQEMVILCVLAVLLFGRRLPEVGRTLGKGIVEFKKGLAGIEEEIETASRKPPPWRAGAESPPALTVSDADAPPTDAHAAESNDDGSHGDIPPHSA